MPKDYKYFDDKEFKRILHLKKHGNRTQAMIASESYFEKYPYDSTFLPLYAFSLMNDGNLEHASQVLDSFNNNKHVIDRDVANYLYAKIRLHGCYREYDKCYKIFSENEQLLKKYVNDFYFLKTFLKKKLELSLDIELPVANYSYEMFQILNYDPVLALNHCNEHSYEDDEDNLKKSFFVSDFDIESVFNKVRDLILINKDKATSVGVFKELYFFKCDHCGMYANCAGYLDYFKVITFSDSNEILTMYPSEIFVDFPYIDITPVSLEKHTKVKRMSQIDKFNKKYNL